MSNKKSQILKLFEELLDSPPDPNGQDTEDEDIFEWSTQARRLVEIVCKSSDSSLKSNFDQIYIEMTDMTRYARVGGYHGDAFKALVGSLKEIYELYKRDLLDEKDDE